MLREEEEEEEEEKKKKNEEEEEGGTENLGAWLDCEETSAWALALVFMVFVAAEPLFLGMIVIKTANELAWRCWTVKLCRPSQNWPNITTYEHVRPPAFHNFLYVI